jgi:ATP-dependent Clp protease ATP-binding subunit ClpC
VLVEVFERFTDRARRVVVLAQEEARMLNHNYIGTEHILLGLIHEGEGVAARALESLGISLGAVRQQVDEIIGQGQQAPSGHMPLTPRAQKVLELASREAQQLGHNYVGTEHILLGLIREGEGVAAQVLVQLGADLNRVRQQVIQLLHGYQGDKPADSGPRRGKRARARLMEDALARMDALDRRLAAIERWVGMRPDLGDVDQEIAQVRREKEAAIDAQDFEAAAALRDKEKELLDARASREKEWASATGYDRPSLVAEFGRVNAELERLRAILREHGLDTDNGAA